MAAGAAGDKVIRIDPKTNKVTAEVTVPEGSYTTDVGEGAVWVTQSQGSPVDSDRIRLDTKSRRGVNFESRPEDPEGSRDHRDGHPRRRAKSQAEAAPFG